MELLIASFPLFSLEKLLSLNLRRVIFRRVVKLKPLTVLAHSQGKYTRIHTEPYQNPPAQRGEKALNDYGPTPRWPSRLSTGLP